MLNGVLDTFFRSFDPVDKILVSAYLSPSLQATKRSIYFHAEHQKSSHVVKLLHVFSY